MTDQNNCLDNIIKNINYSNVIKDASKQNKKITSNNALFDYIGKGGQGIVYKLTSHTCDQIFAVKITKINKESDRELFFLEKIKNLMDTRKYITFIYFYKKISSQNNYLLFMEHANGTLEDWCKHTHTEKEWFSILFQCLYAVYVMQNDLKMYHNDLKPKNILYKETNMKNNIFEINKKSWNIPLLGYVVLIADFGKSQSLLTNKNDISNIEIELNIKNNSDLENILAFPKRILVSAMENKYNNNIDEISKIIKNSNSEDIKKKYELYFASSKSKIWIELRKYPDHVKNKFLFRDISYFAIENNLINNNDINDRYFYLKMPPNNVCEYINTLRKNINILEELDVLSNFICS